MPNIVFKARFKSRFKTEFKKTASAQTVITLLVTAILSAQTFGQSFGQYDSRAVAMGGATVANSNTDQAAFYNPALLSFHDEYEEDTTNGRVLLPVITAQVSESVFDIEDYADENPDQALSDAINEFNLTANAQTALEVIRSAENIESILNNINDRALDADLYFGLAISEPSKREGGAFFLGFRALAGGRVNFTEEDATLLNNYIEALRFISSNGQEGSLHPELFDGAGNLIDNSNNLNSSYTASGLSIIETGVTFSKEFQLFSYPVAMGLSPKLWIVETYADTGNVRDGLAQRQSSEQDTTFSGNMDLGLAIQLQHWQVGLAVKDIFTQNYATDLGGTIKIEPKVRLGAAYIRPRYQVALDIDLNRTDPFATQQTSQDAALGLEWEPLSGVFLRAGYRYDLKSIRASELSAGVGYHWGRLSFDIAYAEGDDSRAASLQFGYGF